MQVLAKINIWADIQRPEITEGMNRALTSQEYRWRKATVARGVVKEKCCVQSAVFTAVGRIREEAQNSLFPSEKAEFPKNSPAPH